MKDSNVVSLLHHRLDSTPVTYTVEFKRVGEGLGFRVIPALLDTKQARYELAQDLMNAVRVLNLIDAEESLLDRIVVKTPTMYVVVFRKVKRWLYFLWCGKELEF